MSFPRRIIPAIFVLLWATGFIGARYALPHAEPFTFLAVRFALALLVLTAATLMVGSPAFDRRSAAHGMVAGALMHGVYLGGIFFAISRGLPAGLAALFGGLQPLITALMAAGLLGERIVRSQWAGLAAGFAGVAVVLEPKLGEVGGGVTALTVAAALVAVVGMSAGTIWQKRFAGNGDLLAGACWQYAGGTLVAATLSAAFESQRFTVTGELVLATVWLVLVLSIGAIFLLMLMIREGAMAKVASFFYLVPAVTAVIAWLVFAETLSLAQVGGMVLATFGVALATRPAA